MADIYSSCVTQRLADELLGVVESVAVVTDARTSAVCHYALASSQPPKMDRFTLETKVLEGASSVTDLEAWLKDQLNKLKREIPSTRNLPLYVVTVPGKAASAARKLLKKDTKTKTDGMIDDSVICVNAVLLKCVELALGQGKVGQTPSLVDWRIKISSFIKSVKTLASDSMSNQQPYLGLKLFGLEWSKVCEILKPVHHQEILQNVQAQQSEGGHRMTPSEDDVRSLEKLHKFFGLVKTVIEKLSDPNKATIHRVITELLWLEGQTETVLPRTLEFSVAPVPSSFQRKHGSAYLYAKEFVKELEKLVGPCGTDVLLFKVANFLDPVYKGRHLREVAKKSSDLDEYTYVIEVEKFLRSILPIDRDQGHTLPNEVEIYKTIICSEEEFHFDPLTWWAQNRKRLPHLTKAAFRILSIPPVAASLESNPDRPTVADQLAYIRENLPAVEEEVLGSIRFSFDDPPASDELNVDEDQ